MDIYKLKEHYSINVYKRADRFELVHPKDVDNSGHLEKACNLLVKSQTTILHDRVRSIDPTPEWEYKRLLKKITPTRILMLSEYNEEFQRRFRSKCYRYISLNIPS